jgi:hypothetical protein
MQRNNLLRLVLLLFVILSHYCIIAQNPPLLHIMNVQPQVLVGGYKDVPVNQSDVIEAADTCAKSMNQAGVELKIVSAKSQVVAGKNYIIDMFLQLPDKNEHVMAYVFRDLKGQYSVKKIEFLEQ